MIDMNFLLNGVRGATTFLIAVSRSRSIFLFLRIR